MTSTFSIKKAASQVPPQGFPALPARMLQQLPQPSPQVIKQLERRTKIVQAVVKLLREKRVPFDPYLLFSRGWKEKLRPSLSQMPEMNSNRLLVDKLEGVQIAGELRLAEKLELTGDAVILTNRIVLAGKDVKIKGLHSLYVFVMDSVQKTESVGTLTLDVSGYGRKDWLETRNNSPRKVQLYEKKQNALQWQNALFTPDTRYLPFGETNSASFTRVLWQNNNGQPGRDGDQGVPGFPGATGNPGATNGPDGSCSGNINGLAGDDGGWGGNAGTGGEGGHGDPGGNASDIYLYITSTESTSTTYNLQANGGDGGKGGLGGSGGIGGTGGDGKRGGNGAGCACFPSPVVGSGGEGGDAGYGGSGGRGGKGGNGAPGGNAGNITVDYPSGFPLGNISTSASGGSPGVGGSGGVPGPGGSAGSAGAGGVGGSYGTCSGQGGSGGVNGFGGDPGNGSDGSGIPGTQAGNSGQVSFNGYSTGGGVYLEPYGSCWYWVYYSCPCGNYSCCYVVSAIEAFCL